MRVLARETLVILERETRRVGRQSLDGNVGLAPQPLENGPEMLLRGQILRAGKRRNLFLLICLRFVLVDSAQSCRTGSSDSRARIGTHESFR